MFTVDHTSGAFEEFVVVNNLESSSARDLEFLAMIGVEMFDCESDARIEAGRYGKPVVTLRPGQYVDKGGMICDRP